jgi:hypothetical protein
MWKEVIGAIAIASVSAYALAQSGAFSKLEGEYSVTTKDIVDPVPEDRRDRVVLSITGKSAKEIFDAMPAQALRVSCDGAKNNAVPPTKKAGGMECTGNEAKGYVCTVAIMLDSGKTTRGYVCD